MCSVSITGDIVITIVELSETIFFLTELKYCGNYACQLWKFNLCVLDIPATVSSHVRIYCFVTVKYCIFFLRYRSK